MKTYKLLEQIEPEDSIPVWDIFQEEGNLIKLNNWNTIPANWLIEQWYIEEVKEKENSRPTNWEAIWKVKCHYIDKDCFIRKKEVFETTSFNRQVRLTKEDAEASIALSQITQLLDKYDIPENSNTWYWKENNVTIGWWDRNKIKRNWLLYFDTEEKLNHFYKYHSDLISKLAPFYIF